MREQKDALEELRAYDILVTKRKKHILWKLWHWLRSVYYWFSYNNPASLYREIKWFMQRGIRGYSDRDGWSLRYYLSKIISSSVNHLYLYGNGIPIDIANKHDNDDEKAKEEWGYILRTISVAFYISGKISDGYVKYDAEQEKRFKEKGIVYEYYTDEEEKTMEEGWGYFKKYFYSL